MAVKETLNLITYQCFTIEDIIKLGNLGNNSVLKTKKKN